MVQRLQLAVEEMTSHGRSDMVLLLHENQVFVFEFKMLEGGENMEERTKEELDKAIGQIRAKSMPTSISTAGNRFT